MPALRWSLSTSNGRLLCSFSRLSSSPLQNFLNHYCIVLCAVPSHSVVSDSVQLHGLQPVRLLCPWGFSRPEYWSVLPCPPPGDLPNPGIEPRCSTLQVDSLPSEPSGKHMVSRWITTQVRKKNHSEKGTGSPGVTLLVVEQQSGSESLSWLCGPCPA